MEEIQMKHLYFKQITMMAVLMIAEAAVTLAHDTTHIHPLMSSEISKLIRDVDQGVGVGSAYEDIYRLNPNPVTGISNTEQFLYWGTDFDPLDAVNTNKSPTDFYLSGEGLENYNRYNNVIDGVVQEDAPSSKVLDHFYHAKAGIGLSLGGLSRTPSVLRAMQYFNEAVTRMSGYHEEAKKAAFFEFGQALHHVEDMSSPAHIHNDPHLVSSEMEKDDYEGWFLPQLKKMDPRLAAYFAGVSNIRTVTNPWSDIWGTTNAASMVNYFYDRTTYTGTLQFPIDTVVSIGGDTYVITGATPPPSASGELRDMFPCPGGNMNHPNCLRWEEEDIMDLAHWKINSVGSFRHQFYPRANPDSWWAVEIEIDPDASGGKNQTVTYQGKYYIEQLSLDNNDSNPVGVPVQPEYMRSDIDQPWHSVSNPTSAIPNDQSLLEIYAGNFLVPAIEFGAGFTQYWYDVANTPPYLKSITISQSPNGVLQDVIVYSAEWLDQLQIRRDVYHDLQQCGLLVLACETETRDYETVTSRTLSTSYQNTIHVDAQQGIVINFEFNEPMKEISLFRIGAFNESNVCIESSSACLNKTAPAAASTDGINWTLTLTPADLTGLNGKLPLTIRARDKNNHQRGTDCTDGADDAAGGELDGTPGTPARRDLTDAGTLDGEPTGVNCYPWHSQDNASPTADNLAYSYDYADGDQNHWLIFDTASPTSNISVDTSLPASQ